MEWAQLITEEQQKSYFRELETFLWNEYRSDKVIRPAVENVFNAYRLVAPKDVKVVILGQDPYPNEHAHGLSFSTLEQRRPFSLRAIFTEICENYTGYDYKTDFPTNDLTAWTKQGVFLLNSILTVRDGEPKSHARRGWETFTGNTLKYLWRYGNPKVFMLWGKDAINTFNKAIPDEATDYHLVLTAGHPAAAAYGKNVYSGNKHFQKANMFLISKELEPIVWKTSDVQSLTPTP
jgi:uracil-DNA glycosylase